MADPFIKAFVVGDAEVVQHLGSLYKDTRVSVVREVGRLAIMLQGHIKQNKLSGQVLRNRTGTLRRDVSQEVEDTPDEIMGRVGTGVFYGKIHEYGWQGQRLVTQAFGKPLKFPVWANVTVPERSYARSGLRDKADFIRKRLVTTVENSVKGKGST